MVKTNAKSNDRQARLAEALRENLRRRKTRQGESGESAGAEAPKRDGDAPGDVGQNPAAKTL